MKKSQPRGTAPIVVFSLGLLAALADWATAGDPIRRQTSFQNVAANAPYECVEPPNYWGWKGPHHGDTGQLTDGRTVQSWQTDKGPIYSLPSSMGWTGKAPVLVFDLGRRQPVAGVGIHTVLSPWGPWWPETLAVLVSDDNKSFHLAGPPLTVEPGRLDPPLKQEVVQAAIDRKLAEQGHNASTHWCRWSSLRASGRYVALIMTLPPDTGTIVLDEIEVYAGAAEPPTMPAPAQVFTEGKGGWKSYRLYCAMNRRLVNDVAGLKGKIASSSAAKPQRDALLERLDTLDAPRRGMPVPRIEGFRAVLPICDLHRRIFQVQAALWRARGAPPLRVWHSHRWDPLGPLEEPRGAEPSLRIVMARNSVRSDVLNLANAADGPCTVRLTPNGLPSEHMDVFDVPLVDTKPGEAVAAALVPLEPKDGTYQVEAPSGMTRQVWIRCRSRGLAPGRYDGTIRVSTDVDRQPVADVPMTIDVVAVRLPDEFSLYLGGWDYPFPGSYQITDENLAQYVAVLHEYGVNVTWAGDRVMPLGAYDADGKLTAEPERSSMDQWLARWPDAKLYCVVLFGQWPLLPPDAPRRHEKIAAWAADWAGYLGSRGVPPDKLAILIRDEPTTAAELEQILLTARAVKQGAAKFKIFNDLHFPDPTKAPPLLAEVVKQACDVQCFGVRHYLIEPQTNAAFMKVHARPGLQWWCYTGGGSHRLTDPYVAWLLRSWFCYANGLTGAHFWAFGDGNGGFGWNEYLNAGPSRSPLYLAGQSVTAGKAMEAMREGAQDYELLLMLEKELASGVRTDAEVKAARSWLPREVTRVLDAHRVDRWLWKTPKDRSVADAVRIKILRTLDR